MLDPAENIVTPRRQKDARRIRGAIVRDSCRNQPTMSKVHIDEKAVRRIEAALDERKRDRRRDASASGSEPERRRKRGRRESDLQLPAPEVPSDARKSLPP
jgi:hypothetical protein